VHIQIVTFQLANLADDEYRLACDSLAPTFAAVPGLLSKVWLADTSSRTYGGVYTWADRASMDAFAAGDLFASVAANPSFVGITSHDFSVIDGPSRVTAIRIPTAA
jgi:hypothetical protein